MYKHVTGYWEQRKLRIQIIALSLQAKYPDTDPWAARHTAALMWEQRHGSTILPPPLQ